MKVISNTGPIIGLAKIGQIFLLKSIAKEVLIPPYVHRELLGKEDVLLLLDDRAGRQVAGKLNVPTIGLIGILLLAKEKGLVENVGLLIEDLRNNGYWLSDEIMNVAKRLAGE